MGDHLIWRLRRRLSRIRTLFKLRWLVHPDAENWNPKTGHSDLEFSKEEGDEKAKDKLAEELFKKVFMSLNPSEEHMLNAIANKMRQLDKSFKIKNTSYKKMTTLAKELEKKGWFKTRKNVDGHLMILDLEPSG